MTKENLQMPEPKISLGSLNYVFNGSHFNVLEHGGSINIANDLGATDQGSSH